MPPSQPDSPTSIVSRDKDQPDRKLYRSLSSPSVKRRKSVQISLATEQELWEKVEDESRQPRSRIARIHRDVLGRKVELDVQCVDVDSPACIYGVFFLIVANSLFIGIEVSTDPKWWYGYVETIFDVAFLVEIFLRLFEKRSSFFTERNGNWKWNVFDLVIVILSLAGIVAEPYLHDKKVENGSFVIEVIRMIRIVRVLRFLRIFRELAIIGDGFFKSTEAVGWITVMLLFLIYFCAVLTTGLLGRNECVSDSVRQLFHTVAASMLTLFQVMTLDDWVGVTKDVMSDAGWGWGIFFCGFVLIASFTFLGLLSAVLTDHTITTMRESHSHKEKQLKEQEKEAITQMLQVFEEMDADGSGYLTRQELLEMLRDDAVQDTLHCMNWHFEPGDVEEIYGILDADQSGQIDRTEFVEGFMQLRGEARAKDLFALKMLMKKELVDIKERLGIPLRPSPQTSARMLPTRSTDTVRTAPADMAAQSSARGRGPSDADSVLHEGLACVRKLRGDRVRLTQLLKEAANSLDASI